jgi:hypothetical protein
MSKVKFWLSLTVMVACGAYLYYSFQHHNYWRDACQIWHQQTTQLFN